MKHQPDQPRVGAYSSLVKSCTLVAVVFFFFSCTDEPKLSSEASLTSLTLTVEGVDYPVTFTGKQGTITVPYSMVLPGTATVKTVVLSAKATGVKVGDDLMIPVSGVVALTVMAEDSTTKQVYTILVKKETPSSETSIASLTLTVEKVDYQVYFTDGQAMLTLSYGTAIPTMVSVESVTLSPGATGVANDDELPVRNNTVTLTVIAENGTTQRTYTIALSVVPDTEASITALTLNAGGTDYPIAFTDRAYTLTLPEGSALPTIVSVTSVTLSAGAAGVADDDELPVMEGGIITLEVTAEDGETKQEYTVTLVVSQATATAPLFTSFKFTIEDNEAMALEAADRKEIVGTIDNDANSITFPEQSAYVYLNRLKADFTTSAGATVQVGGADQTSGVTEQDFTLPVSYVVRAQDGTETTYTVTLFKSSLATIEDDNFRTRLQELFPAAFTGDQLDVMHDEVINNNGKLDVTNQTPKLISLKGIEFFRALTILDCHDNSLTSSDVSANTALINLYCNNNNLRSLDVSANTALTNLHCGGNRLTSLDMTGMRSVEYPGALDIGRGTGEDNLLETLRMNTALQDRTEIVAMKTARGADLTITTVDDGGTVVCADYSPLAEGGRCGPLSNDASITTLTLDAGGTDYEIAFTDRTYTLTLPENAALPTIVSVTSVTLSAGAAGVADDDELPVTEGGIVTLEVTAEDGETKQEYTVTIVVSQATAPLFTSFKFTLEDNEAMALEEADRKEIVGTIDNDAKSITFPEQSAYVYLNRLKASFTTSAGATVQVGGADQTSGVTEQDFTLPVSYVIRAQDGAETTYTVTLIKSTMAMIPDASFRAKLQELFPAAFTRDQLNITHDEVINNNGKLDVTNQTPRITSLKGIEFFTALRSLYCSNNSLTSLDVSENTALRVLDCRQNGLTSLDVSMNTALTDLRCYNNALPSLDVSANTALTRLDCYINSLTSLDVSANTALIRFHCGYNALTSLDVSKNTALRTLYCHGNSLPSLDLSKNTALNIFWCKDNLLTSLDMTGMRSIIDLTIGTGTETDNPLDTLRVNTALQDRTEIIAMKTARGADLTITTVDDGGTVVCANYSPLAEGGSCGPLSDDASITTLTLDAGGTDYEIAFTDRTYTLTLPENAALPTIVSVTSVTLSAGAAGVADDDELPVTEGGIVTLEVTAEDGETTQQYTVTLVVSQATAPLFTSFKFTTEDNEAMAPEEADRKEIVGTIDNDAKSITFPEQSAYVYLNRLKADFTTSTDATVWVGDATQTSGVTEQDFTLPVSYVVRAQDGTETTYTVTLAKSTMATIPDPSFRAKLQELFPTAFTEDQLDITHDEVLNNRGQLIVNFQNPRITSLKGIEFFTALTHLDCHANNFISLNVSKNTALTFLDCSGNKLTSLDVSANTSLLNLNCSFNSLISLNVSKNTALTTLNCGNNLLTSLNMTGMRSVTALNIGRGTGTDNLLETLRVNTVLQDRTEIIAMKTSRGADLTIITVDDGGTVVCDGYSPLAGGGRCGPLSNDASITALTLTVGSTDYEIAFTDRTYTLTLPENAALPTIVSVTSVTLSAGAAGVADDDELPVIEGGIVTLEVTAEDGETKQEYTVTIVVSQATATAPLFTSFTFTAEDNEAMALEEADRKEIVGTIDNDANSITFPDQSAYVYLNRLKATFTTSAGATVQVGGADQTSGVTEQDFSSPVSYVVRAQDGTETTYTVTLAKSNKVIIPDAQFRMRLQQAIPAAFAGDELYINNSYVIGLKKLNVSNRVPAIASLKGIEFFVGLTNLRCSSNAINSLDFRKNVNLVTLTCNTNMMSFLNLTQNKNLTELNCKDNTFVSLDVSQNTALEKLDCSSNSLTSLDVSKNTALIKLTCNENRALSSLNVKANRVLEELVCSNNSFNTLDLRENKDLKLLSCGSNPLNSLDVSKNKRLSRLICSSNTLTSLDVRQNKDLQGLDCGDNTLTSLDVSKNTNLTELICGSNQLDSLDVSRNTALTRLRCQNNSLTSLDMTGIRRVLSLFIGTGINGDNLLEKLRVNTAVQDRTEIITMKMTRGSALTITTVGDKGAEQCLDYIPAQNGGTCNQAP